MTVMAEATQLTVKPDMPMGARLRLTHVETGRTHEGIVAGTFSPDDYGVTLDTAPPWGGIYGRTIPSNLIRTGQVTVERLDGSDSVAEASAPVPIVVGTRIRVRQESATPGDTYTGHPPTAYQGQYGSVNSGRSIPSGATFDDHRTVIQVDLDNGERGIGVYVGWIEPDTRPLAVDDYVRVHNGEIFAYEGTGWVEPAFRNQVARVTRAADETGSVVVEAPRLGRQLIHESYLTRTTAPPVLVNPMEVGTRVATSTGKGTVVSKDDERLDGYSRTAYMSSDRYVAVLRDGERTAQMFDLSQVNVVVDVLEGLSPEQQILRLQTLVHRVASYEAVRRDWCHEVNGALAMLNLPDNLSTVDRDLGRALGADPKLIFQLDVEVEGIEGDDDEDDDEDNETEFRLRCDVNVSYDDHEGWSHSGQVSVYLTYLACHDDEGCIDDVSSMINDQMVRDAINDSDQPNVYSLDSWDLSDWEVTD